MKRYGDLYNNICNTSNIMSSFKEVMKNTRNERRVELLLVTSLFTIPKYCTHLIIYFLFLIITCLL